MRTFDESPKLVRLRERLNDLRQDRKRVAAANVGSIQAAIAKAEEQSFTLVLYMVEEALGLCHKPKRCSRER